MNKSLEVVKKYKKIFISAITVIVLLFISISIWPTTSGTVIDSATGKPVVGIMVERRLSYQSPFGWESNIAYKYSVTKTDENGHFVFPFNIKIKFIGFGFEGETILVNHPTDSTDVKKMSINNEYFFYSDYCSNGKFSPKKCDELFRSKNKKILLSPKVEKSADCVNNALCLEMNSRYLVLKENDQNICTKLENTTGYKTDMYYQYHVMFNPRDLCYMIYAANSGKGNSCDLLSDKNLKKDCLMYSYNGCSQLIIHYQTFPDNRVNELCAFKK